MTESKYKDISQLLLIHLFNCKIAGGLQEVQSASVGPLHVRQLTEQAVHSAIAIEFNEKLVQFELLHDVTQELSSK